MRIQTITAAALGLALTPTHAEMVAQHIDSISNQTGIVYQLSDTKCKDGSYRVLISTTDTYNFPAASMYGDGCWSVSNGTIHIVGKSFGDGIPINIIYDANLFKAGNEMVDWSKFAQTQKSEGPTGKAKALVNQADRLNDICRNGRGKSWESACQERDKLMEQVEASGWCWGPDDAVGADKRWIRCAPDKTKNQCQQLYQSWVFNQLLENACNFNQGVALGIAQTAEKACSLVPEQQLTEWKKNKLATTQKYVNEIGLPEFCRENKQGYDDIKAKISRAYH